MSKVIGIHSDIKTEWQKKDWTASTTGIVTSASFYNLTIGKTYRYIFHVKTINNSSGDDRGFGSRFLHNGIEVGRCDETAASSTVETIYINNSKTFVYVFVAQASSITWDITTFNINSLGGGFVILEELPNHESTTQWT